MVATRLRAGAVLELKDNLSRGLSRAGRGVRDFGTFAHGATRKIDGFATGVASMGKRVTDWFGSRLTRIVSNFFTSMKISAAIGTAAFSAFVVKSINDASKFEQSLRNTTGLIRGAGASSEEADRQFAMFSKDVLRMAPRLAKGPQDLANTLYDIVSGGFEGADATVVLEAATKGAAAGMTDATTVGNALVKTLAAYGKEAGDAQRITDLMFQSVNLGIITFEEMAQQIGDVVGLAATARVPFEDLMGAIATMTRKGLVPAEAFTSLNQLMLAIISPSNQEKEAATALWGDAFEEIWSGKALAKKGLSGVMKSLTAILKATPEQMKRLSQTEDEGVMNAILGDIAGDRLDVLTSLFGNVRALRGALLLGSDAGYTFQQSLKDMDGAAGATDRVMAEAEKTFQRTRDRIKSIFDTIRIQLASGTLPMFNAKLKEVSQFVTDNLLNPLQNADTNDAKWAIVKEFGRKLWTIVVGWWEDNKEEISRKLSGFFDWLGEKATPFVVKAGVGIGKELLPAIFKGMASTPEGAALLGLIVGSKAVGMAGVAGKGGGAGAAAGGLAGGAGLLGTIGAVTLSAAAVYLTTKAAIKEWGTQNKSVDESSKWLASQILRATDEDLAKTRKKLESQSNVDKIKAALGSAVFGNKTPLDAIKGEQRHRADQLWKTNTREGVMTQFIQQMMSDPKIQKAVSEKLRDQGLGEGSVKSIMESIESGKASRQVKADFQTIFETVSTEVRRQAETATGENARFWQSTLAWLDLALTKLGSAQPSIGTSNVPITTPLMGRVGGGDFSPGGAGGNSPKKMAKGGFGTVYKPTWFLAGEAGAEDYAFVPRRGGGGRGDGGGMVVQGPLIGHATISSDMDVEDVADKLVRAIDIRVANR